ncbi:MAG: translocation/assembly module TamB domain-containing protein [Gammaproteobacteria bacterium]|nr:translocation/assembly module TamB domain-containing protein [Gammaproteobacteria bacterium]
MSIFSMTRLKKWLLAGLVSVLLLIAAGVTWLLYTDSGASWIWQQVVENSEGAVSAVQVDGNLSSGFVARELVVLSDGMEVRVGQAGIEAGPDWWPLSVEIRSLDLRDVEIATFESASGPREDEPGMDIRSALAELNLPVAVALRDAQITNVTLQRDDEATMAIIDSLAFGATLDEVLAVDHFSLLARGIEAELNASLLIEPPFDLAATLNGRVETGVDGKVLPLTLDCSGDLDGLQFRLVSQEYGLLLDGDVLNPLSEPSWNVKGSLDQLQWPLGDQEEMATLSGLAMASMGAIDDWSLTLASGLQYQALQKSMLQVAAAGNASRLEISEAGLVGDGIDITAKGSLDWSAGIEADISSDIVQLDVSPWIEAWQAGQFIQGTIDLNWSDAGLHIPSASLTVAGTDVNIDIKADIDIGANRINALLDWQNLSWPLAVDTPDFASPAGRLDLSGSLDQWQAGGAVSLRLGDYPDGELEIDAGGTRTAARFAILSGAVLGGSFRGEASADWSETMNWNAVIHARDIDPEPLLQGWPGRLNASLNVEAQDLLEVIELKLPEFEGSLRGVAVAGSGELIVENGNATFKDFVLNTDEAVLQLDGSIASPAGARLSFNGYLPSMLLDGARGRLELQGRLSQHGSRPLIEVQMEGLDLAWNGFSVKTLSASAGEAGAVLPMMRVNASGFAWQDLNIDEVSFSSDRGEVQQKLSINMVGEHFLLDSALSLIQQDPSAERNQQWRGALDELQVDYGKSYHLELLDTAAFEWSSGKFSIQPVCLQENGGAGLCINGEYRSLDDLSLVADVSSVPLDYLREALDLDISFDQLVDGRLEWRQSPGRAVIGGGGLQISAGGIFDLESKELVVETSQGGLEFVLQNGNLESGMLDLEFSEIGYIDVDFEVLDIIADGARLLRGRAISQFDDISIFGELLSPGIDELRGRFESDIKLDGTLVDPAFSGRFSLANGLVRYVPLGLKLEDIEFEGLVERRDRGSLKGRFRAGEGTGILDGDFVFEDIDRVQMNVTLSGERLMFINTDNLKIETETDLKFGLGPERMDINGFVLVPSARLTPANLLIETVNDSEDLVVESRETEPAQAKNGAGRKMRVFGELEVAFGDDVKVKVPDVETNLSGSVLFNWSGDPVPMAKGSYLLQGIVDVYGPRLEINNGRISFPDVPANNPLLNIRAEREVFGNTQIRSAGVQVIGNLKRPVVEAYTVPITNEDRAWTLLVTGSDFDQGQGVGGFDIGTYIAPRLYVSYGISLFEDENVVSARYDLKRGFGIKVTSGQRETGLDVSYTIDR